MFVNLRDNKYLASIDKKVWDAKLEDWFSTLSSREEKVSIQSPKYT